ncbi:MAG TPA: MaoC family dehydratase N-terminal domain-containing protein [Alicycliphilus sp.]|nr:MaoC family dehydratase N-terminal domain-containing protein [Alicycliphilus sp.]
MWDASLAGTALTPFRAEVERGRLRAFARATGQEHPLFLDEAAARAAGHPALLVPPTFLFCLAMEGPNPQEIYERLDVNCAHVLHGEQHFDYHRPACAGQTLHFAPRIGRLYAKKGGALRFFEWLNRVTDGDGRTLADLRSVMVERPPRQDGTHAAA